MTPPPDTPRDDRPDGASGRTVPRTLDPDYEAILAAVTETARGRWFLAEYARRNRTADTRTLLSALNRLEKSIARAPRPADQAPGLAELIGIVGRARTEIAAVPRYDDAGPVRRAAEAVDFVTEAEPGKAAVLQAHEAAERIQEIVWNLRERQVSGDLCDAIDRHAVEIQAACREETATLKSMVVLGRALRALETRLRELVEAIERQSKEEAALARADFFADDPAVGRFLEDMEIVDVVDVGWYAPTVIDDGDEAPEPIEDTATEDAEEDVAPAGEDESPADDVAFVEPPVVVPAPAPVDEATPAAEARDDTATAEAPLAADAGPSPPAGDPPPVAPPVAAPLAAPLAATVTAMPTQPATQGRPAPQGRAEPPADLTGLTFDQKMILFS